MIHPTRPAVFAPQTPHEETAKVTQSTIWLHAFNFPARLQQALEAHVRREVMLHFAAFRELLEEAGGAAEMDFLAQHAQWRE